jgi:hypothetical protein
VQADLKALAAQYGSNAYWIFPSVFWLDASDTALKAVALGGMAASLLLFANILSRLMLPLLFLLYLSVVYAGQVFFNFQWDSLLLETGFLAIFLPYGSPFMLFLLHWVLFRLRFLSGLSKLLSGDEAWANFTALDYYFETQPLPHIGAWCPPTAGVALRVGRLDLFRRTAGAFPDVPTAAPAGVRGLDHHPDAGAHHADEQPQLLQPADHRPVPAAV